MATHQGKISVDAIAASCTSCICLQLATHLTQGVLSAAPAVQPLLAAAPTPSPTRFAAMLLLRPAGKGLFAAPAVATVAKDLLAAAALAAAAAAGSWLLQLHLNLDAVAAPAAAADSVGLDIARDLLAAPSENHQHCSS